MRHYSEVNGKSRTIGYFDDQETRPGVRRQRGDPA